MHLPIRCCLLKETMMKHVGKARFPIHVSLDQRYESAFLPLATLVSAKHPSEAPKGPLFPLMALVLKGQREPKRLDKPMIQSKLSIILQV